MKWIFVSFSHKQSQNLKPSEKILVSITILHMFWKNFEYLNLAYRPKMLARLLRYCCLILY